MKVSQAAWNWKFLTAGQRAGQSQPREHRKALAEQERSGPNV